MPWPEIEDMAWIASALSRALAASSQRPWAWATTASRSSVTISVGARWSRSAISRARSASAIPSSHCPISTRWSERRVSAAARPASSPVRCRSPITSSASAMLRVFRSGRTSASWASAATSPSSAGSPSRRASAIASSARRTDRSATPGWWSISAASAARHSGPSRASSLGSAATTCPRARSRRGPGRVLPPGPGDLLGDGEQRTGGRDGVAPPERRPGGRRQRGPRLHRAGRAVQRPAPGGQHPLPLPRLEEGVLLLQRHRGLQQPGRIGVADPARRRGSPLRVRPRVARVRRPACR